MAAAAAISSPLSRRRCTTTHGRARSVSPESSGALRRRDATAPVADDARTAPSARYLAAAVPVVVSWVAPPARPLVPSASGNRYAPRARREHAAAHPRRPSSPFRPSTVIPSPAAWCRERFVRKTLPYLLRTRRARPRGLILHRTSVTENWLPSVRVHEVLSSLYPSSGVREGGS